MNIIDNFLEMLAAERAATNNTISAYKLDLEAFAEFITPQDLASVKLDNCRNYIQYLQKQSYSARSINRKISSMKQFYQFLSSEEIITDNPTIEIDLQKQPQNLPKMLQVEEVDKLFAYLKEGDSPEITRLSCMLAILYSAGLRVSELVSLKLANFEYEGAYIKPIFHVIGKGNKERVCILNERAQNLMLKYLTIREFFIPKKQTKYCLWLFPSMGEQGYITRNRFGQLLKELALKAGLDPENISPHVLRHSFASHLLANGADLRSIQELLGHSSINTTQIYTHLANNKLRQVIDECHPLSGIK